MMEPLERSAGVVLLRRRLKHDPVGPPFEKYESCTEQASDAAGVFYSGSTSPNSSAAVCSDSVVEALAIKRGSGLFELPKGHVEGEETLAEAARRELMEETGVTNMISLGPQVGVHKYQITSTREPNVGRQIGKEVTYFAAFLKEVAAGGGSDHFVPASNGSNSSENIIVGPREVATTTCCWLEVGDLKTAAFRSECVKDFVHRAFELDWPTNA